jgi:hypothetical protein
MKVLFLDCDGVLNTRPGSLDEDKLAMLAGIVNETACDVVVSSSWRTVPHMLKRLSEALLDRQVVIHGVTPELSSTPLPWGFSMERPRHEEITAWLLKHPEVESYCILDDMSYADDGSGRFVQTNAHEGLTDKAAQTVIGTLLQPLVPTNA